MNGAVELYKACQEARRQADRGLRDLPRRRPHRARAHRAQPPDAAGRRRRGLPEPRQALLGRLPGGAAARQADRRPGPDRAPRGRRDRADGLPGLALLPAAAGGPRRRTPAPTPTTCCGSSAPRTSTSRSRRTGSRRRTSATRGSSGSPARSAAAWSARATSTTCAARTTTTTRRCSACRPRARSRRRR